MLAVHCRHAAGLFLLAECAANRVLPVFLCRHARVQGRVRAFTCRTRLYTNRNNRLSHPSFWAPAALSCGGWVPPAPAFLICPHCENWPTPLGLSPVNMPAGLAFVVQYV